MIDAALSTLPVFGICGYSGSGKTQLIEHLIPRFLADGLSVAVIKHDAHGLDVDRAGKDSDRLFRAGATVFVHDSKESYLRQPTADNDGVLARAADFLAQDHDLVIVEGHKQTALPAKLWLRGPSGDDAPAETGQVMTTLDRDVDRSAIAYELVAGWLLERVRRSPVWAGLLIGGRSSRMGQPKHLIQTGGRTWAERIADAVSPHVEKLCIIGTGDVPAGLADCPRLPDAPDRRGPTAGMLAAMRWQPRVSWVFAACDMPYVTPEAVGWLIAQRVCGCWAILPRQTPGDIVEPLLAFYDFRARRFLEITDEPRTLANFSRVTTPAIPLAHMEAWRNVNTKKEVERKEGPLPRLAGHVTGRTTGAEGTAQGTSEAQAPY